MKLSRPSPNAVFEGAAETPSGSALEFWQWAYGDLLDDDVKGAFAEWLVHKLLDVVTPRRVSWANSDVITPEGVRIEVKSTSFWQSWKLLDERGLPEPVPKHALTADACKIRFSGLKARDSTAVPDSSKPKSFKSDLYVFAFQNNPNPATWNAFDLRQWEFYLASAENLRKLGWESISLATLRTKFTRLSASELSIQGKEAVLAIASRN
jgi:hypothetical protein